MNIKKLVLMHVRASGPVSFGSIRRWVRQQFERDAGDHEIAAAITQLIQERSLCLYDTGDAFDYMIPSGSLGSTPAVDLRRSQFEDAGFRIIELARGSVTWPDGRVSRFNFRLRADQGTEGAVWMVAEDINTGATVHKRLSKKHSTKGAAQ